MTTGYICLALRHVLTWLRHVDATTCRCSAGGYLTALTQVRADGELDRCSAERSSNLWKNSSCYMRIELQMTILLQLNMIDGENGSEITMDEIMKALKYKKVGKIDGYYGSLYCDKQNAITLSGNATYHAHSKHIDVRYHFVREKIAAKQVMVQYKYAGDMVADILTKGLYRPKHLNFTSSIGLILKRLRSGEDVGSVNA
ncbi:Retrovirus-related Pol polyprotein from transposon TNT 1-94 [Eumeta japonica]|uniref:Retrovirus-related Pol polyprotein from transposon TNT 1-94 n=1 Tax=Eumeta variegata TaxID=151549 RepID=A0A4C1Z280_EUMVA|nr:Retrovirus-related Pol polyprotein from transposon TNT 1-94 [Eumeta japonica]